MRNQSSAPKNCERERDKKGNQNCALAHTVTCSLYRVHSYDITPKKKRRRKNETKRKDKKNEISHTFEPVRHLIGRPFSYIYISHSKLRQSNALLFFTTKHNSFFFKLILN